MSADVFLTYFGLIFVVTVALALRHNAPNKPLQPTRAAEPFGKREAPRCVPRG